MGRRVEAAAGGPAGTRPIPPLRLHAARYSPPAPGANPAYPPDPPNPPGLIGWVVINLAMAHKQLAAGGGVSAGMALVCGFQALYVLDALWFEAAILTTMDITTDGFGFMLAFGDLAWVPFTYSLQARVLVDHAQVGARAKGDGGSKQGRGTGCTRRAAALVQKAAARSARSSHRAGQPRTTLHAPPGPQPLSALAVGSILALKALGYLVFRGANSQKDLFRRDPAHPRVASLRTLPTERGTRLIISGWWGIARHINYTGDWLMG